MKRSPENLERLRATRKEKAERGEPVGRVPLGYVSSRGSGRVGTVVPDEFMLGLIEEARAMQADGRSLRTILRVLGPKGLVNRRGRRLSPSSLMRILKRPQGGN